MTQEFTIDWPHGHRTRDGRPARIICTDRKSTDGCSLTALVYSGDHEWVLHCLPNGKHYEDEDSEYDLVNKQPTFRAWVNVYPNRFSGVLHDTKENADFGAGAGRMDCIEIVYPPEARK